MSLSRSQPSFKKLQNRYPLSRALKTLFTASMPTYDIFPPLRLPDDRALTTHELVRALMTGRMTYSQLQAVLSHGTNPNGCVPIYDVTPCPEYTPIMALTDSLLGEGNLIDGIKLLLHHGAVPQPEDAYIASIRNREGDVEVLRLLVTAGKGLDLSSEDEDEAYELNGESNQAKAQLLLQAGLPLGAFNYVADENGQDVVLLIQKIVALEAELEQWRNIPQRLQEAVLLAAHTTAMAAQPARKKLRRSHSW